MREEVIYGMESAYREPFTVRALHFGGGAKTMCVLGALRGNEIQPLYIASQLVRKLRKLEEEGCFNRSYGVSVIPCANPYSVNIGKRFWAMDNSDINRMFPGYSQGETTQRIAAGIFEKIQGYKYGVQFSSFYLPGIFVPHVRMMQTSYEDISLAQLFGLPFVTLRKPVPYDTTTLNFNWQVWDTKAFSIYSRTTASLDLESARKSVSAILRFLARMGFINYNVYGGYESTVLYEEELLTVRSKASGLYVRIAEPFGEVEKGEQIAKILDPLSGETVSEVRAPESGIVFFCKDSPLVMEHETLFKLISKLHH